MDNKINIKTMFQSKIKARVFDEINKRIQKAEETHTQKCAEIDADAEAKKDAHATELVHSIIGK